MVSTVQQALELFMNNGYICCEEALAKTLVVAFHAGEIRRPSDEMRAPRCVVSVMLAQLGHHSLVHTVWPPGPSPDILRAELDGFESWFGVAMAVEQSKRKVRTKSGFQHRVRLAREDASAERRSGIACVGDEWKAAKKNQRRNIVINALIASHEAKRYLVDVFGPRATSLGSTGVERGWWYSSVCIPWRVPLES